MKAQAPVIILLLALAIMMWSAFVWRRKFHEAEKESTRYSIRVTELEIDNHKLNQQLVKSRRDTQATISENRRLRDHILKTEGGAEIQKLSHRVKESLQVGKRYADWPLRLGVVEFDPKTGKWSVTYPP